MHARARAVACTARTVTDQLSLAGTPGAAAPLAHDRLDAERDGMPARGLPFPELSGIESADRRELDAYARLRFPIAESGQTNADPVAPVVNLAKILRERAAAGRFAASDERSERVRKETSAYLRGLQRGANSQTVCSFERNGEGFADEATAKTVALARTQDRPGALSIPTRAMLPPLANSAGDNDFESQSKLHTSELYAVSQELDPRLVRAFVRRALRKLYPVNSNLRKCGERRWGRRGVDGHVREGRGSLAGIVRCGSAHACVKCAPRISNIRGEQLREIVTAHRERGEGKHDELMMTTTVPHRDGDRLAPLRRKVQRSWQLMQQGEPWKRVKRSMGVIGYVGSRETTHGANGWHPHQHTLILTDRALTDRELLRFKRRLYVRWARSAVKAGFSTPSYKAFDLSRCHREDYLEKLGLIDELLAAFGKLGRRENRTPFQIATQYAVRGDQRDATLFREFIRAMKRKKQLTWSRGKNGAEDLRKIYAPDQVEMFSDDATLLQVDDVGGEPVVSIPARRWDALVRVMRAGRGDAEYELVKAIEAPDPKLAVDALFARAHAIGVAMLPRRPKLRKWLWWIEPHGTQFG